MTTRKNPTTARAVYEIKPAQGRAVQVEAASAGDLAQQLASAAGLDPYGSRAVAHVLHVLRGTITAPTFSARRLGVLEFRPDHEPTPAAAPRKAEKAPAGPARITGPAAVPATTPAALTMQPAPASEEATA